MIVFLDTNIVIYAVETPPGFGIRATAQLAALRASNHSFLISDLTRMECLVGPLRSGDIVVEADYRAFFSSTGVQVASITPAVCDRAAAIRAAMRFNPSIHFNSLPRSTTVRAYSSPTILASMPSPGSQYRSSRDFPKNVGYTWKVAFPAAAVRIS